MYRELFHIWGPFSINSFGLFVGLGLWLFSYLVYQHPTRKHYVTDDQLFNGIFIGIIAALFGGRLLYILENPISLGNFYEFFALWQGGISVLGTIIALLLVLPIYLMIINVPVLRLLDVAALYAPLIQCIARIGCFCAGCCYGIHCTLPWAVQYSDQQSLAPLNVFIHPTQLYSAGMLFFIFLYLRYGLTRFVLKPGTMITSYIILVSSERFLLDFWRADKEFISTQGIAALFTLHQWVALGLIITSIIFYRIINYFLQHLVSHESV